MKVLHLNSYDLRGGSETVFNVTRENSYVEENLSAFIPRNNGNNKSAVDFISWDKYGGIKGAVNYIYSGENYRKLKLFLSGRKIDIIHFHDIYSALSPSVLKALKETKIASGAKIIQTVHDYHLICPNACLFNYSSNRICEKCIGKKIKMDIVWNNCDRRGFAYSFIKGLRCFVGGNILKQTDFVDLYIAPSSFLMNKMIEDGIEKSKITLLANPMKTLRKHNPSEKENLICYFGRLSGDKNVSFLLNAFIQWKSHTPNNFKLMIIGEGEEEPRLKTEAANSPFAGDIIFKPFMQHNELMGEIARAKYFTMSSIWYENAPMVILEAFVNGLIPIVPKQGGMEESIQIVNCGRAYEPGNMASWIEAVNEVENNYSIEYQRLVDNQSIIENYDVSKYQKTLYGIYKNITGKE